MKRILVLLVASAASCSTPSVSVVPYAVRSSLEGAFSSSELNASAGTTDLGLDDPEMVFGGRIDLAAANSMYFLKSEGFFTSS